MSLRERLKTDLYQAMKDRDRTRVSVLRLLRSAVGYEEIEKKKELDDEAVIAVISRGARQRRESIEMYRQGNRPELAEKEEAELALIQEYLPAQLGEEELEKLACKVVQEVGASGPGDKGKVMGRLMGQVKGKADGSVVNKVVIRLLETLGASDG
jgi:uncharacterized protein YqeY